MSVKAASKMLVKLTLGVNFIYVIRENFLYKSFFKLRFGFEKRTKAQSYVKFARLTLVKLTVGRRRILSGRTKFNHLLLRLNLHDGSVRVRKRRKEEEYK